MFCNLLSINNEKQNVLCLFERWAFDPNKTWVDLVPDIMIRIVLLFYFSFFVSSTLINKNILLFIFIIRYIYLMSLFS